ncbi:HlyD family secretion protein [Vibrio superstes]|uniref:Multidrug transporter n=1 Tax=Vibrio superstes NBRC 103154 TaxID=1219062 RepID=A0A511QM20_9VIBR|nr:HlyD family efflux transporter periplasmic adaptor subunit [Vibrio superstes]GEM78331.1 multidrug transporter [Vibrio superstes NBRC 103154]
MKELLYPYIFICWILIKTKLVKPTKSNYAIMIFIGVVMNVAVYFAHRHYSPVDLTNSAVVRAQSAILSPATESVEEYFITHNDKVKKGQILYTLVDNNEENRLVDLKAQLAMSDNSAELKAKLKTIDISSELEARKSQVELRISQTERDIQRMKSTTDAYSPRDIENAENLAQEQRLELLVLQAKIDQIEFQKQEIRAQITNIKHQQASIEAQIEQVKFEKERLVVRAPFDGMVTRLDTAAGSRFGNIQIWNTETKILEMRVPDQLWSKIEKGMFAEFYVDAYPGHIFRGRVHSFTGATGEAQGSHFSGETTVSQQIIRNSRNIGRTILIEFEEPKGIDIPIGARGSAWVSASKPFELLGPIDMLGGATLRLSAIKSYLGTF